MSQVLERLYYSPLGQNLISRLGLSRPPTLQRFGLTPKDHWVESIVSLAKSPSKELEKLLSSCAIEYHVVSAEHNSSCLLFDATDMSQVEDLANLRSFFSQAALSLKPNSRIVIIALNPSTQSDNQISSVMYSLDGFTRSLAKEVGRKGTSVNLIYCDQIHNGLSTPVSFLLSNKAAYISGQPLYVNAHDDLTPNWLKPLDKKIALVTGAAQGIGKSISQTLARDGAHVIGLDIPASKSALNDSMSEINGTPVTVDITSNNVVDVLKKALGSNNCNAFDIVVHNAGVTRDKMLSKMPQHYWELTLEINLAAPITVTKVLDHHEILAHDANVICISSISGIAGNLGQTNYSTSKSGIAGYVKSQANSWKDSDRTINAIAPGFIETQMTHKIPFVTREIGRRMNAFSQGGLPQDVAEAVSLFANPSSKSLNGQVLRVCGQSIIGA